MIRKAFNSDRYLSLQRDKILERIHMFSGKLYLEFGGKMFQDSHASRVIEYLGEFDYVHRPLIYTVVEKMLPVYSKIRKKLSRHK